MEGVSCLLDEPFLCDPDVKNKNGFSPLLVASKENNLKIISLLLEAGADPNTREPSAGMTSLHLVLSKYHVNRRKDTCEAIK